MNGDTLDFFTQMLTHGARADSEHAVVDALDEAFRFALLAPEPAHGSVAAIADTAGGGGEPAYHADVQSGVLWVLMRLADVKKHRAPGDADQHRRLARMMLCAASRLAELDGVSAGPASSALCAPLREPLPPPTPSSDEAGIRQRSRRHAACGRASCDRVGAAPGGTRRAAVCDARSGGYAR